MAQQQQKSDRIFIGIAGPKGSGKTATANGLAEYLRMATHSTWVALPALADTVKHVAKRLMPPDKNMTKALWGPSELRDTTPSGVAGLTVRQLLQQIGEGMRQCVSPDVWLQALVNSVEAEAEVVLVPDVRYMNEAEFILSQPFGHLVQIQWSEYVNRDPHITEQPLPLGMLASKYPKKVHGILRSPQGQPEVMVEELIRLYTKFIVKGTPYDRA